MPTNSSFRMQGRGATVAEENRTKSHGNCLPWKPAHQFFLLLLSYSFGRGGCISCQLHNNNGTHLAFITAGTVKQHVISKGFQSISCAAVNFCRIRWYRLSADARTMEPYPWDLGNFTIVAPVDANQTLRFQSADDAAEGSYVCVASNGTHQINRSTHLTVDVRYWTGDPLQLQHKLCHNRTAEVGQNVTLFCQFYVGLEVRLTTVYWRRPNTSLPQEQWSGCGQGWDWLGIGVLRKVSHYTTYHMRLIQHMNDSGSETPWIGSRLDIVNVSEEAYGIYCVIANNGGHWSRDVLMLSPPDEKPRPVVRHYQELPWVVVGSAFLMVSVSLLVWKMVALEVKLWYHGRYGDDEQNGASMWLFRQQKSNR
ncbi:uncharacterized protein LOC110981040 isoform X2 [Acanthaster planci]|uniref:Soluble interferon alpha/beta receptor OPG204 n=1 Tax=Acanthaster planci TaxID=133434 RepID=A0A8B7YKV7_ACAPL|nr:uncharacterized protein LOC110981040 isoform X2 [Acanthaster planci]